MEQWKLLKFLSLVGKLKMEKRRGWVLKGHPDCETVAGHMYRMAMTCFLIDGIEGTTLNRLRCMELALVHDLAECIIGDLTPSDCPDHNVKMEMEFQAMEQIVQYLPPRIGDYLKELLTEYYKRETLESQFVKECDLFDFLQQAFEYEQASKKKRHFQDFFDYVGDKFKIPFFVNLKKELDKQRAEYDSDLI